MKSKTEVIQNYEAISDWFDANRTKDLMEKAYLEKILDALPKNASILDLGCGTGEPIANFFIKNDINVVGLDGSSKMIQYCKKRFPSMVWIVGDMRDFHLDQAFDAVIVWDSLFHLTQDEQKTMFPKFRKHLKNRGLLLFTSGPKAEEIYGTMDGHEFYHASLDIAEYESILAKNGFKVLLNKIEDPDCGEHTVWLAQVVF